jgi:hypothetical protein
VLVRKYWPVFDKNGVFVPVKHYECVINTGDSTPIAVKRILYGPKETPVMRRAIAALNKVDQIHQKLMVAGSSKPFLLPNPIKSMYETSTILSGASASTTSH